MKCHVCDRRIIVSGPKTCGAEPCVTTWIIGAPLVWRRLCRIVDEGPDPAFRIGTTRFLQEDLISEGLAYRQGGLIVATPTGVKIRQIAKSDGR